MQLKNEIIEASAGSGKTYRLTNRYISLLQLGVEPERIIALTFTRKAAGEFFDAILEKLARSAADENNAAAIAGDLGDSTFTSPRAGELLREFIDSMPQLALGTLDSFLADIVRAFPLELGLGGGFEVLDEYGMALEKERVYQRAFGRGGTGGNDNARRQQAKAYQPTRRFQRPPGPCFHSLDLDRNHNVFFHSGRTFAPQRAAMMKRR